MAPDGRIFQTVGSEAGYTIVIHTLSDATAATAGGSQAAAATAAASVDISAASSAEVQP